MAIDQLLEKRLKDWEIIADNLSKSGLELGLRVSFGLRGANDLDRKRASRLILSRQRNQTINLCVRRGAT